ncbi:MAG TPA: HlyD family efflux transporter periplasmic adaptor subunit [Cellvibrio sp.]|nr:HlyD family efflux transporter periplasmic adaptor subunit [Cellvibrio sp.]
MLGNVNSALLVQVLPNVNQIVAKWPTPSIDSHALNAAISPVLEKQRLHLHILGEHEYLLGQPLIIDGRCWGVLVCNLTLADKKELPQLLKMMKLGQFWLQFILQLASTEADADIKTDVQVMSVQPALPPLKEAINTALAQLMAGMLKENSLQETAITLVNLLAGLLQASRVSLGLLDAQGKNLQLEAVSFSANFDKRTQAMQAITEAMAEAIDQGLRIDCIANAEHQMSDTSITLIKQAHHALLHSQQLKALSTFLLRKGDRILGALTLELNRNELNADEELLIQQAMHCAAAVIVLRQQATAGFWQGIKQRLVATLQTTLGGNSWRAKLIAGALVVLLVVLFVPIEYQLSADASLQTTEKHLVVSPQDAYLGKISVRPGDAVKKGAVLAQLNDDDLRLERRKIASQAQQYRQAYDSALANSNRVEAAIANAQLDQANIQLQLIDQQLVRTQLVAPIDGIIVSDDITQTRGAPVKQGDVLFEVAAGQHYRVQLFVDERDIAQVQQGQNGQLKLASLPTETFNTRVKLITPISEVREGRNYFRVEMEIIDVANKVVLLRPGMTGTGKVEAGKRAVGWIWFHDIWHWLRLSIW